MSKRGPSGSGFQPSREKYHCPVKNCNSDYRGDDIAKHFQTYSKLSALDKANENQALLRKNIQGCDVVELSENNLDGLLLNASETEKLHTIYLFQHGFSSSKLPNFNSVNFKCQQNSENQKKKPIPAVFKSFFPPKKVLKIYLFFR